jgi:signal transduction histidine kinase
MSKVSSDEDLEDINQSASESLRCIEEILEGSFNILRKKGVVEKFKTNEVIEKVIDMLSWRLKSAGISVRKQLLKETYIVGDRSSFSRIFLNLLLNSVEELEMCGKKERYIYIKTWVSEDRFFFSIKDTGRGIRDTLLDDIQNKRFYSSDCNHLGVGLFFVFNTVRSCFNGEVRIETELGDYTNVEICIPL